MTSLKIVFEHELVGKPKSLSLGWLISQAKLKLNIKLKLELRSSFWGWNLKKLHYQMLKSLKLRRKKIVFWIFAEAVVDKEWWMN